MSSTVHQPPLEPHLRASFSRHRAKKICHHGSIYLPAPSLLPKATFPLFLLAFQVQTFTAAYWQLSLLTGDPSSCSAASSPATLLLAAPPPHQRPFFFVRTPILSHTDLACNISYHFASSHTVSPRVPHYLAWDHLHLLAHVYDSFASIHMTKNQG